MTATSEMVLSVSDLYSPSNSMPKALRTSSSSASFCNVCVRPASSVSDASTKADSTTASATRRCSSLTSASSPFSASAFSFCAVADVFVGGLGVKKLCMESMKDCAGFAVVVVGASSSSVARSAVLRGRAPCRSMARAALRLDGVMPRAAGLCHAAAEHSSSASGALRLRAPPRIAGCNSDVKTVSCCSDGFDSCRVHALNCDFVSKSCYLAACKTLASTRRTVNDVVFASRQASEGGDDVPATVLCARNHMTVILERGLLAKRARESTCTAAGHRIAHSAAQRRRPRNI